jgi:hypothetical protein
MDVAFTDPMDGIWGIFNENNGEIWPNPDFPQEVSIVGQAPRL